MKQIFFSIIFNFLLLSLVYSQEIPTFIYQRLDSVKKNTKKELDEYRITEKGANLPCRLSFQYADVFTYKETLLIDSLNVNLSIEMIYDDEMRNRIIQLMRNEYREDELDTLVNRRINNRIKGLETETLQICKLDTMYLFKVALDSFYINLPIKDMSKNMYKHDILLHLQIDTMTIFKQAFKVVVERERERERERETQSLLQSL